MASAAKPCAKLLRGHACYTAIGQIHQGIGEAAHPREADIAVKPQAVLTKTWNRAKSVPASIVGETAEVSQLGKVASRNNLEQKYFMWVLFLSE
jgi:hypothetical protein